MCGIAGIVSKGQRTPGVEHAVEIMLRRISHRGPDSSGVFYFQNAAIGAVRLSIIDLNTSDQPIVGKDLVLVFNGEIFNYRKLKKSFKYDYRTSGDGEVLLAMYEAANRNPPVFSNYLKMVEGFFTFAILDTSNKRIILGRDYPGVKPLYIVENKDILVFSSEIKALLPFIPSTKVELETLKEHKLAGFRLDRKNTFIKGIKTLAPGELLSISLNYSRNAIKSFSFYTYRDFVDDASPNDLASALRILDTLLTKAVASRIVSDVPVSLAYSGGMDSTAVLIKLLELFGEETRDKPHIISVYAEKFGFPREYLEEILSSILAKFDVAVSISLIRMKKRHLQRVEPLLYPEEPILAPAVWITDLVAQKLKKRGLRVVLLGEGSDEVFGGYTSHKLWLLPKFLLENVFLSLAYSRRLPKPMEGKISKKLLGRFSDFDNLKMIQLFELEHELPNLQLLRIDKIFMKYGVEAREPFLYKPLIRFGISLPPNLKSTPFSRKRILKIWLEKKAGLKKVKKNAPFDPLRYFMQSIGVEGGRSWLKASHP